MTESFFQVLVFLLLGITVIILLTAKYRLHPFFALLIACFIVGLGVEMNVATILNTMKTGFGRIMQNLGLLIVMGTTLGVLLEHSGCTKVMANYVLKKTGEKRASLAMSITGFIVGLPVFCDSGYIVLSGLNQSLAKRTGISVVIMATSLATGLYAVHCLLPPHPGAAAAAVTLGVDPGRLLAIGIAVAIPGMLAGYFWANYAGKKLPHIEAEREDVIIHGATPSVFMAFLPVVIPVLLIAMNSIFVLGNKKVNSIQNLFSIIGDPVIALSIGVLLVFVAVRKWTIHSISKQLMEGVEKAGGILVITGAGGAFGAILSATDIGRHFGESINLAGLGILFPFVLAFILKTAQGSSTVAIITAASIVFPLLPALGLDSDNGKLLCVLSMGAGSMMVSHANDSYFWVISKFSGIEMKPMLKVYSIATTFMGLITLMVIYLLSFLMLK